LRNAVPASNYQNLENDLNSTVVAPVNRSVLVAKDDSGRYSNIEKDLDTNALRVRLTGPATAFGETQVASIVPEIQLLFTYGANDLKFQSRDNNGTLSVANGLCTCSTGASANSSSAMLSQDLINYQAGQGIISRFTGVFTEGVANSEQWIGIGDEFEGFFFGYNGADFGVLHRRRGEPEVRTLTVTTASTTDENITVTLDGDADATVAVTNTGNTTLTANEIAAHDYSTVGDGWSADAVGSTVVFTSWTAGSKSGSYSISGSTAAGTFVQTNAGADPTEDFTAATDWDRDMADGTGALPAIDWTKGNVFQVQFQYLGFGKIDFLIENPSNGRFVTVHEITYTNTSTLPSLFNPTLPLYMVARNFANTSNIALSSSSMMAANEGITRLSGIRRGTQASRESITTTELPVLTIRNSEFYGGTLNKTPVKINLASVSNDHTKAMIIRFYANATLTNASFSYIDANTSPMQVDTSASVASGGVFLFAIQLGANGSQVVNVANDQLNGRVPPGQTLTVTGEAISGTGATCSVALNWVEGQ